MTNIVNCIILMIIALYNLPIGHAKLENREVHSRHPDKCGIQKINYKELIMHGSTAYAGQFPWHVALYHGRKDPVYKCGGSLISARFVMTAEHCTNIGQQSILVRAGLHNLGESRSTRVQELRVKYIHRVSGEPWVKLRNDIAILELDGNVKFNDFVQPICINKFEEIIGANGVVPGWGKTENATVSAVLKYAKMPIIDPLDCLRSNRDKFSELDRGLLCGGHTNGTVACVGDSGGGFYFKRYGVWYLTGVVAFSAGSVPCNSYTAFTKIYEYLPWISAATGMHVRAATSNSYRPMDEKMPPWFGALFHDNGTNYLYVWSVTIISERYVITASHANILFTILMLAAKQVVRVGLTGMDHTANFTQQHDISNVEFIPAEPWMGVSMLALRLNTSINSVKNLVEPIALWDENAASNPAVHQFGYMIISKDTANRTRYDFKEIQIASRSKMFCSLTAFNETKCFCGSYEKNILSSLGVTTMHGSGLYWNVGDQWYLRGIFLGDGELIDDFSFDIAVFMNIEFSRNLIQDYMGSN